MYQESLMDWLEKQDEGILKIVSILAGAISFLSSCVITKWNWWLIDRRKRKEKIGDA